MSPKVYDFPVLVCYKSFSDSHTVLIGISAHRQLHFKARFWTISAHGHLFGGEPNLFLFESQNKERHLIECAHRALIQAPMGGKLEKSAHACLFSWALIPINTVFDFTSNEKVPNFHRESLTTTPHKLAIISGKSKEK